MTPNPGTRTVHPLGFGAELLADRVVRFRLWAPPHRSISLALEDRGRLLPMRRLEGGWHEAQSAEAGAGTLYRFVLPDGTRVPDPASRHQPRDVHGPSEVIDPASYLWRDAGWSGRPWHEAVVYELHIGAFSAAGTFVGAIERLDHLAALGVTAIEIMPVADFPGGRSWGYDGVLPYAPDSSYGRPEQLKQLVDAAHARGLMVLLDVVYNHFGPDGDYLPAYAPGFFTQRHHTPWGAAINYDGDASGPVREFIIHNALYWLEEFHMDGLRLDAVHAIIDEGPKHILEELAQRARAAAGARQIHLLLENEENQAAWLLRDENGAARRYTAQWNDDLHHVLHTAATGEDQGYYREYLGDTHMLGRALAEGFAFQGEIMHYRGRPRGQPSAGLPPQAFVAFIQNHDQVGNRALGERLGAIAAPAALRAVAAVYLLLPQVPMLFMGEEWAAAQPFPFFCDFPQSMAAAVREGRRSEFAKFPEFRDDAARARIPDPQAEATFESAKLRWGDTERTPHAQWLAWYRSVLELRRTAIVPLIPQILERESGYRVIGEGAVLVQWAVRPQRRLILAANLCATALAGFPACSGSVLWQEGEVGADGGCGPWTVRWSMERHAAGDHRP